MRSVEFLDGKLRVRCSDHYRVDHAAVPGTTATARVPVGAEVTSGEAALGAALTAFGTDRLDLVAPPVDLAPIRGSTTRELRAAEPARLELRVAPDEDAVVLLEQDGVLSWRFPVGRTEPVRSSPDRRETAQGPRTIRFVLDEGPGRAGVQASVARAPGISMLAGVRAYVFKFVASVVAGEAVEFLERDIRQGLVAIESATTTQGWRPIEQLSELTLPLDRPARILLMIHGTFSTTVGSFGALTTTPAGRRFLATALSSYDAVIGFDHPTLSVDPLDNATELLRRLSSVSLIAVPTLDVVCYSRGGLVARSLIEYLLPRSTWRANSGRVVFVGATNGGTLLAEPRNWHALLDLYTNLATACGRAIGVVAGNVPAAEIVNGSLTGVAAFVKYLVSYAAQDNGVPGLAAMRPDGDFIRRINQTQPGQPRPGTPWFVVSSDFEPGSAAGHDLERTRLRRIRDALVTGVADTVVDQLLDVANDLVVDTASMSAIDSAAGCGFVEDTLALGTNPDVHHLGYFIEPRVCDAMLGWLLARNSGGLVESGTVF